MDGYGDCIWLRAYERLKSDGIEQDLLKHAPVIQNQGLRGTSAWANNWLGRDHAGKKANGCAKNASDQLVSPSSPANTSVVALAKMEALATAEASGDGGSKVKAEAGASKP